MFDIATTISFIAVRFAGHSTDVCSRIKLNAFICEGSLNRYEFNGGYGMFAILQEGNKFRIEPTRLDNGGKRSDEAVSKTNAELAKLGLLLEATKPQEVADTLTQIRQLSSISALPVAV